MNTSTAIVIVAKLPVAGKVKTRLFSRFSPATAALLHERLFVHTLERIDALSLGKTVVLFDPPDALDAFKQLIDSAVEFIPQVTGDLGDRLAACVKSLRERFDRIVFFGCDSPDVPEADIRTIIRSLGTSQLALGPTEDGGFWTIGFDRSVDVASLLAEIPWSSGRECESVLAKAAAAHLEVRVGARWSDVDHPSDVDALLWRLEHSRSPADVRLFTQLQRIVSQTERNARPASEPSHA